MNYTDPLLNLPHFCCFRIIDNKEYLVEQMEDLKYESEDLYTTDEPSTVDSTVEADR